MIIRGITPEELQKIVSFRKKENERKLPVEEKPTDTEVVKAYVPELNNHAINMTMDNYRQFVDEYNTKTIASLNSYIIKYNSKQIDEAFLTDVQKHYRSSFYRKFGRIKTFFCPNTGVEKQLFIRSTTLTTEEYNKEVHNFNEIVKGVVIPKEPFQKIKANSEAVFRQMLCVYAQQLEKRNQIFKYVPADEQIPVRMVEVCSTKVSKKKRKGIKALDVCSRTIINHRKRFQEAKLLVDYKFIGAHSGTLFHINPKILVIFDRKTGQYRNAENQSLMKSECKKVTDNNMNITRTLKDNNKIKANASSLPERNRKQIQEPIQEHQEQTKNLDAPSENSEKSLPKKPILSLSDRLQGYIQDPLVLAEALASGKFDNYKVIDIRYLQNEAYSGILSNLDFKKLAVQEMLRQIAKIYKGKKVYAGTWFNAYNLLMDNYFVNFKGVVFQKFMIVENLQEYRWRIDYAYRYALKHPAFNLLFPSLYFDRTRNTKAEGGFEYTKKAWTQHLKDQEDGKKRKAVRNRKAELRKAKLFKYKDISSKIKQYIKNRLTLKGLFAFVEKKYPEYLDSLNEMIQKIEIELNNQK